MLVRALSNGFFQGKRIRVGQEFHVADEKLLGKWMEVLEGGKKKPAAKAKKLKDEAPAKEGKEELSKDDLVI